MENKSVTVQDALIEVVQRKDIDPERLQKFLDLQVTLENRQAEKDFYTALTKFQSECPTIVKNKKVSYGKTNYAYAALDEIVEVIKPHLKANGLAYSFDVKVEDNLMEVVTKVFHTSGWNSSSSYMTDAMNDGGQMNNSQRRKSALTYAKRASLENALGLVTAGEDDDAIRAIDKVATDEQKELIAKLLKETSTDEQVFLNYMKVENIDDLSEYDAKRALTSLRAKKAAK